MIGYIYETTCLETGKIYIGCKVGTPETTSEYFGSGLLFRRALNKYGQDNFVKRIVDFADSKEQLLELEKFWIAKMDSRNRKIGYNITEGGVWGDTKTNHPNLKEICKKISDGNKGKVSSKKGKKNTEFYGEEKAEELRIKNAESHTGNIEQKKKKLNKDYL